MSREDLNELLDIAVKAAQYFLGKNGEFFPFGVSMDNDGKGALNAADIGEEQPPSEDVIAFLEKAFRKTAQEKTIRAAGICFDARVVPPGQSEKTDAIGVRLEDRDGEALEAYVPYRKGFLKRFKYGELFAGTGTACIFTAGQRG